MASLTLGAPLTGTWVLRGTALCDDSSVTLDAGFSGPSGDILTTLWDNDDGEGLWVDMSLAIVNPAAGNYAVWVDPSSTGVAFSVCSIWMYQIAT